MAAAGLHRVRACPDVGPHGAASRPLFYPHARSDVDLSERAGRVPRSGREDVRRARRGGGLPIARQGSPRSVATRSTTRGTGRSDAGDSRNAERVSSSEAARIRGRSANPSQVRPRPDRDPIAARLPKIVRRAETRSVPRRGQPSHRPPRFCSERLPRLLARFPLGRSSDGEIDGQCRHLWVTSYESPSQSQLTNKKACLLIRHSAIAVMCPL